MTQQRRNERCGFDDFCHFCLAVRDLVISLFIFIPVVVTAIALW